MYIHEYGNPDLPTIILLHPMEVTGENLYNVMSPYLKRQYHIISPDQGGHGQSGPYTDCKTEAAELEKWLLEKGYTEITLLYGASMGVGTAYELLKSGKIRFKKSWFDGGAIAPNAVLMNWLMRTMFLKKLRALKKDPTKPVDNLIKMYGEEFAAMMKENFIKLSEQDITNICNACCHRELVQISPEIRKNICFEYGQSDPNLKAAKKTIKEYFPESRLIVREGYGHCGYMAFHTEEYVKELETFMQ